MPQIINNKGRIEYHAREKDKAYKFHKEYIPENCSDFICITSLYAKDDNSKLDLLEEVIKKHKFGDFILVTAVDQYREADFYEKQGFQKLSMGGHYYGKQLKSTLKLILKKEWKNIKRQFH